MDPVHLYTKMSNFRSKSLSGTSSGILTEPLMDVIPVPSTLSIPKHAGFIIAVSALIIAVIVFLWLIVFSQETAVFQGDVEINGSLRTGIIEQMVSDVPLEPGYAVVIGSDGVTLEHVKLPVASPILFVSETGDIHGTGSTLSPFRTIEDAFSYLDDIQWSGMARVCIRGHLLKVADSSTWNVRGHVCVCSEHGLVGTGKVTIESANRGDLPELAVYQISGGDLTSASFVNAPSSIPFTVDDDNNLMMASAPPTGTVLGTEFEMLTPSASMILSGSLVVNLVTTQDKLEFQNIRIYSDVIRATLTFDYGNGEAKFGPGSVIAMQSPESPLNHISQLNIGTAVSFENSILTGPDPKSTDLFFDRPVLFSCTNSIFLGVTIRLSKACKMNLRECLLGSRLMPTDMIVTGSGTEFTGTIYTHVRAEMSFVSAYNGARFCANTMATGNDGTENKPNIILTDGSKANLRHIRIMNPFLDDGLFSIDACSSLSVSNIECEQLTDQKANIGVCMNASTVHISDAGLSLVQCYTTVTVGTQEFNINTGWSPDNPITEGLSLFYGVSRA